MSPFFLSNIWIPSRRCFPTGDDELTKWLSELSRIHIGMAIANRNTALIREDIDLEKGLQLYFKDGLGATARPEPALRKQEEVYSNESFISSTSTLTAEKISGSGTQQLPNKKHGRTHRNMRFTFFSVYRRLHLLVVLANIAVIAGLWGSGKLSSLETELIGTAAAANLLAAILIRQELIINLLFATFGMCPHWLPLRIRRLAAKIYHLGGVHSGAGIAATIWWGIFNVPIVRAWKSDSFHDTRIDNAVLTITIILDVLLIGIVTFSHPWLRSKFHNVWEAIHRFAGWTAVALFWAHVVLSTHAQEKASGQTMAELLGRNPLFWILLVVTVSLILPWLRLRRVPVRAEHLSTHAVRLHFGYTNLPLCAAPRFSDSPLKEWHAFAGIPESDGVGFSVLVSDAGDWTKKIVQSPPKQLWTRGIPARGVLHVAPIFKKLVLVATGSGIGPILSLLYARNLNVRIIWSTKDPIQTYSSAIVEQVIQADPEAVIINTTKRTTKGSRPNLVQEAYDLYQKSQAEAVFVISNPKVTRKVVYGLESRGVPIFAPIFDS